VSRSANGEIGESLGGHPVAEFTTGLTPAAGGPYVSVAGLVRGLAKEGTYRPLVAAATGQIEATRELVDHWQGGEILSGRLSGNPFDSQVADEFTRRVLGRLPTVVHVHGLWDASTCAAMRVICRRDVPVVVSPRGMLEPWALRHRWLKKRAFLAAYLWPILARADLLHATSEAEAETFRGLRLRQPLAVIPNGVDLADLPSPAGSVGGTDGPRRLLYLGRLHMKKGLENLLRAWSTVRPNGWRLSIAGIDEGGYEARLKAMASQLGIQDSVDFPGPMLGEAKWRYLSSGTAFVHPSFSENFGIAVAEAMAAGLPVIATVGTPWSVLEERGMGWWVDPDPFALAKAIRAVVAAEPNDLRAMGGRARLHVRETFDWPTIAAAMASCYSWLRGTGPMPACIRID
jgi:glycosyltransferase involved in cell wall biosynthesis